MIDLSDQQASSRNASSGTLQDSDAQYRFTCVSCLHPSEKLYNSSIKNLKLTTCASCSSDVDPYIEREFVLVAMDMILLQRQAYRHALCNRHLILPPFGWMHEAPSNDDTTLIPFAERNAVKDATNKKETEESITSRLSPTKSFTVILLPILLTTMTKHQNYMLLSPPLSPIDQQSSISSSPPVSFFFIRASILLPLMSLSIFEFLLVWFGTIQSAQFLLEQRIRCLYPNDTQTKIHYDNKKKARIKSLQLGIFLPQLFHIATLLVQIYDQTRPVRTLGSIFVFLFLYISVDTVMEREIHWSDLKYQDHSTTKTDESEDKRGVCSTKLHARLCCWMIEKIPAFPLLLGLSLRWIIPRLLLFYLKDIIIISFGFQTESSSCSWNESQMGNEDQSDGCDGGSSPSFALESHFSGNLLLSWLEGIIQILSISLHSR